jgi:murein DD-endopeptidase MepM/ murein hydrolase activator NlpD
MSIQLQAQHPARVRRGSGYDGRYDRYGRHHHDDTHRGAESTAAHSNGERAGHAAHMGGDESGTRRNASVTRYHRRVPHEDYTFAHAGRQIRIGPVLFWICVGTLVIMATWSIVTATYFAFRDDVLGRLLARQAEMQFAYEDRLAEMRARVDRVTSRQLLDQEQFERKLDQLLKRQSALESRTSALGALADPNTTGSIKPATRGLAPDGKGLKPSPLGDRSAIDAPGRAAGAEPPASFAGRFGAHALRGGIDGTIARIEDSLDRVEARQTGSLNAMEQSYDARIRTMRGVLADLGLDRGRRGAEGPTGGPYVPFRLSAHANAFERQVQRVSLARVQAERLSRTIGTLPIRKPIMGEIDTTSGFGVRLDPFIGRPAMHTGIDFRGDAGDPVRATASGTVTHAGWSGGYGKMVEIDHGHGLATRYGHLSAIDVAVGQSVKIGQIVGRVGSTGRSTGPHLHYETRVNGEAVDPQKFLRAGMRMGFL